MSNIDAATSEIVGKWQTLADEIAERQTLLKDVKQQAKDEGYNVRVLAQLVKERRKGAKYQADQLQLELELSTYRASVGLPTTLEDAQKRAAAEARGDNSGDEAEPFGERDTVQFGDGPEINANDWARGVRGRKGKLQ